jgi:hypothetical protein
MQIREELWMSSVNLCVCVGGWPRNSQNSLLGERERRGRDLASVDVVIIRSRMVGCEDDVEGVVN